MPSMVRHSLQSMLSVGYYRNIYCPPDSGAHIIHDFSRDGRLLQTLHLGSGRRVLYKYTKQARLSEIIYDTTLVTFTYDDSSGMIKTIHLMHNGFICTIRYRQTGVCFFIYRYQSYILTKYKNIYYIYKIYYLQNNRFSFACLMFSCVFMNWYSTYHELLLMRTLVTLS